MNLNTSFNLKHVHSKDIALLMVFTLGQLFVAQASPEQASQMIKMTPNKRIEASICADSMNRIAVSNDRIMQIFGDEGAFESQNDEATGQVFLKPTAENGSKSLSLTLITEQGITQDLILKPISETAKTLVLQRDTSSYDPSFQDSANQERLGDFLSFKRHLLADTHVYGARSTDTPACDASIFQVRLIALLKQAITGQLPVAEEEGTSRSSLEGYAVTFTQSWQAGPYEVSSYRIENITEAPLSLQEKDFYQPGDLALSFDSPHYGASIYNADANVLEKRVLPPQETITLYVARLRKAERP